MTKILKECGCEFGACCTRDCLERANVELRKRKMESRLKTCGIIKSKLSDALAVHPTQVAEAIADAKKKGVPTDFAPDGRPIITSRNHQKRYLRAYGFFNRDSSYGD